ncbi:MAG: cyclic nucleotide-binding domain-containing protein [Bacteroidales bacterium]|nr:cyclic nucleotide-binding domain-containing protein [Bacteroidales bacterium]
MEINTNKIDTEKKIKKQVDILRDVVIFSESDEKILKLLASFLTNVFVDKNEAVFHKGDQLNAMYIIVEGRVKVHDGDHIFTHFGEKDFFGEYSLIDSSVRSATVTAVETTHLLRLDQEDFHKIIEDNIEVSKAVLKALIKRLRDNNILEERLTQNSLKIERQRDELDKQKKELEELNATKDKFFTIIAHDLKNPFNTVIGLSELLVERYDTYDSYKIKEFIRQINKFSNDAYNLLEDLLKWAKSQTGRIEVKPEKVDVFELAIENINFFQRQAEKKGVKIDTNVEMGLLAFIDRNMICTVLRNLISNSVKYTNPGDIINIEANSINEHIEIFVTDTGIGIPEKNLEKIFKIDSNISTQGTADETGTGLGLIISREFVEKNGGTINVKSKEGNGTQFMFTVPIYKEKII